MFRIGDSYEFVITQCEAGQQIRTTLQGRVMSYQHPLIEIYSCDRVLVLNASSANFAQAVKIEKVKTLTYADWV
jgi:hypothetical protein